MPRQSNLAIQAAYDRNKLSRFVLFSSFIIAVFLLFTFVEQVHAQTEGVNNQDISTQESGESLADAGASVQKDEPLSEVIEDETITTEDLGAVRARILPDSPWHIFKRIGQGIQEAFTFDTVKDAALKHKHANQQLAEVKQLIEEKGINGVAPKVLERAIQRFENKMESVAETAGNLKEVRDANQGSSDGLAVDALLDDVLDKQIKRQKLLDNVGKEIIELREEVKEEGEDEPITQEAVLLENVLGRIQQANEKSLEEATEVLVKVEEKPTNISDRIIKAFDNQSGSNFRDLKNLQMLELMEGNMPESAVGAIELAKQQTIENFEVRIKEIPPAVRAKKFKDYVGQVNAVETKLFQLLEDIRKSGDIPTDILDKIEEAKEIVVGRFEEKLSLIENREFEDRFVIDFDDQKVDDLIMMEEFKRRMKPDSKELKRIEEEHKESLDGFKRKFTDTQSQEQAKLFEKLSKEMATNPTPKTFKLLRELEAEVMANPEKRAFLEKIEGEMRNRVEDQFRREGDKFVDRFVSLDPEDMAMFDVVEFDDKFRDRLFKEGANKLKDFARDIEHPEDFDRFYDRFYDVPDVVIERIREYDPQFQDAMQFKVRRMEEVRAEQERKLASAKLDFEEREAHFQLDRKQRQKEEEFWKKLNEVPWEDFETRKALWNEKIDQDYKIVEDRFSEQKRLFEKRMQNDPWCDDVCRQIQIQFMEQDLRHERERLADDLLRERNRLESEQAKFEQDNPLSGKCDTPESCEKFCTANSSLPECGWMSFEQHPINCPPPSYWDQSLGDCRYPDREYKECDPGFYWDSWKQVCTQDPYYHAPEDFKKCSWGSHWEELKGSCEPDIIDCSQSFDSDGRTFYSPECQKPDFNFCPPGFFWDDKIRDCRQDNFVDCSPGFYFDHYTNHCEKDSGVVCSPGEYWDETRGLCVREEYQCPVFDILPCPAGQFREHYQDDKGCWLPGECRQEQVYCPPKPYPCPAGEFREESYKLDGCTVFSECRPIQGICPEIYYEKCPEGYKRDFHTSKEGCQMPGECYPVGPPPPITYCGDGQCTGDENSETCSSDCWVGESCGYNTCTRNDYCADAEKGWCCPNGQIVCTDGRCVNSDSECTIGYCGDGQCLGIETSARCPSDCGQVQDKCPVTYANNYDGSAACNTNNCPDGCVFETGLNGASCPSACKPPENYCGNNVCDSGETNASCPSDCNTTSAEYCGDGLCNNGENSSTCPTDCSTTSVGYCGDNICNNGETSSSCSSDCGSTTGGSCYSYGTDQSACAAAGCVWYSAETHSDGPHCDDVAHGGGSTTTACDYDGICESGESTGSCPSDCNSGTSTTCPSTVYNNYTTSYDCNYSNCPNGCNYDSTGCPISCWATGSSGTGSCPSGYHWHSESGGFCIDDQENYSGTCYDSTGVTVITCPSSGSYGSSCSSYTDQATCTSYTNCNWYSDSSTSYCYYSSGGGSSSSDSCPSGYHTMYDNGTYCMSDSDGTNCLSINGGTDPYECPNTSASSNYCDGICGNGEDTATCPGDCGVTEYCGDYICNNGETESSCPSDCGSSGGSSCSSTPSLCTTEAECTSYNFFWCNSACYSNSSLCPTSFLPGDNEVLWQEATPAYRATVVLGSLLESLFIFVAKAMSGF